MDQGGIRLRDIGITAAIIVTLSGLAIAVRQKTPSYMPRASAPEASPTGITVQPDKTSFVHSPDGTLSLTMVEKQADATTSSYVFSVTETENGSPRVIYESREPARTQLRLPANSWSPDNKMVFILGKTDDVSSAFVFKADGSRFADGVSYIDVGSLFRSSLPDLTLREVTGWDDPWLLHVTTRTAQGEAGQSYWFDVSTRSFMELNRKG